jgi:hypothetical protein
MSRKDNMTSIKTVKVTARPAFKDEGSAFVSTMIDPFNDVNKFVTEVTGTNIDEVSDAATAWIDTLELPEGKFNRWSFSIDKVGSRWPAGFKARFDGSYGSSTFTAIPAAARKTYSVEGTTYSSDSFLDACERAMVLGAKVINNDEDIVSADYTPAR